MNALKADIRLLLVHELETVGIVDSELAGLNSSLDAIETETEARLNDIMDEFRKRHRRRKDKKVRNWDRFKSLI